MLVFNLKRILALRGIDKPYAFLVRNNFHRTVANNLANNRAVNIKVSHLETLCRLLSCTPNDLFEWKEDKNSIGAENHPLNALSRQKSTPPIKEMIKDFPVEKMEQLERVLNELKGE